MMAIRDDEISVEDYKKMLITEKTQVSDACVEELEKREVEVLFRVWSRILYSTLGEFKEIGIDDFVNGEKRLLVHMI